MKHIVKFKIWGERKQRTVEANNIYDAERKVRNKFRIGEYSTAMQVQTIKAGRRIYEVNGTVLGG